MRARARSVNWTVYFFGVFCAAMAVGGAQAQYGGILQGAGATNRSMAGASTAAPLSAAGALYWNPATLSGLPRSELEGGAELLFLNTNIDTRFNTNVLGPGIPPAELAGRSDSDIGVAPLPTIGLAYLPDDSPLGFGLGVFAVAGFGVNYAGSNTNPILTPRPPVGVGFGPVFSDYQVLQVHPAVTYKLTDRFSIGAGPILNLAKLRIDPFVVAAPDNANGDMFFTYPPGTHEETTWGAGFALGAYYQVDTWAVGASLKSPQWFDTFRLNSFDELGRRRRLTYGLDLPLIVSVGAAYTGWERWLLTTDVRWIDYASANGFGESGFALDGAVRGPGWKSIFAVAVAAQYLLTDAISLRAGYSWNENAVPDSESFINTVAPAILQHNVATGLSWNVTEDFTLSLAYVHGFENSIQSLLLTPTGPVPGTSVRNEASYDSILIGATVKFGSPRGCRATPSICQSDAMREYPRPPVSE